MKARVLPDLLLSILLAGGAVTSGFAQDGVNPLQAAVPPQKTGETAPAAAASPAVEPGAPSQPVPQLPTTAPAAPGSAADQPLASDHYLSPWYCEIEKLTQARVEDAVVLSYIYNSAATFILTADQVIALKNLGASPQVIGAMMRHDRQFITGERLLTASASPPLPPSVQIALAASLDPAGQAKADPTALATPSPAPTTPTIAPEAEPEAGEAEVWVEPYYVPDPPQGPYPVRLPYPVKLNDPIIMLRLPSFALPCRQ